MFLLVTGGRALYISAEIAQTMSKALHFNTFGGNPMATAVASAVIDVSVVACHVLGL